MVFNELPDDDFGLGEVDELNDVEEWMEEKETSEDLREHNTSQREPFYMRSMPQVNYAGNAKNPLGTMLRMKRMRHEVIAEEGDK